MAHVLLAVPRMIVPALSGGEIRVTSLIRALQGKHRFSLITFLEPEKEADLAAAALYLEARGIKTHLVARGPVKEHGELPRELERFDDAAMHEALKRAVADDKVDLVHLEFSQMAHYAPALRGVVPVVATEHDSSLLSPSHSYFRQESAPSPNERAACERYLRESLGACARVVTVSDADAERLSAVVAREKLRVVPTGVDLPAFPFKPLKGRQKGSVAFLGHYPHFPNEDAALFFCKDVLPLLKARAPEARAVLLGSRPTPAVLALRGPDVEVTGTLPEIAPALSRARVFIAPMRLGFGIKGKLLEAFACGTPVVATPAACEAMPGLHHGRHLLTAPDAPRLAQACARLLQDEALSAALAKEARAYVEERFGWDRQAGLLDAVYREALAG